METNTLVQMTYFDHLERATDKELVVFRVFFACGHTTYTYHPSLYRPNTPVKCTQFHTVWE